MCGIAGITDLSGHNPPMIDELAAMAAQLQHRGPDGQGFYCQGSVGLAHTRLSIIDLTGGTQPIHNEQKDVWVIFNGEVFNYLELRADLERQGHHFYTHSDTEVLVHLYEQYGDDFLHKLNGQFALAIWDARRHRVLLARDRVGIAPLFYQQTAGRLLFASEVKALLTLSQTAPRLDPAALDQIFTFWAPVSPTTAFADVQELSPGQALVVENGKLHVWRWWDWQFPQHEAAYLQADENTLAEQLHDLLVDATRIRLRADVPVGAYLSGGLDSSVILSLIHHHTDTPLRTFSIGFEHAGLDESEYQQQMINHLKTDHSRVLCTTAQIGEGFLTTLWHTEMPILRMAPVPMRLLSESVRAQQFKVVLTGEGADEVLGGYDIFKEGKIRQFWARHPDSEWRAQLFKKLYPYLELPPGKASAYFRNFFGVGLDRPEHPGFAHFPRWDTTAKAKLFFSEALQAQLRENAQVRLLESLPPAISSWSPFQRSQYIEAKVLMGAYLLCSQGDRMLMANSVEGRFPFLDHRVIEFANQLRPTLKMRGLNEKYLLKKAMQRYLPPSIVERHKQPYRAPDIPAFLKANGQLQDIAASLLSPEKIRDYGYFDEKKVSLLVRKVERGGAIGYKDNQSWVGILSTQALHYLFIENFHSRLRKNPKQIYHSIHTNTGIV